MEDKVEASEKLDLNELKKLSNELNATILKISAKTTEKVDELFQLIGIRYLEKIKKENPEILKEEEKENEENEGKENENEEDNEEMDSKEEKKSKCCPCLG